MTNLRKAAEQALEALENIDRWLPTIGQRGLRDYEADAIQALRQALAEDALKTVADIDHSIGLFVDSPKKWVGLTDEEIHEVVSKKWWDWEDAFDIEGFSRAIEAKLKEKNT